MSLELILKYFPEISAEQREQFSAIKSLYKEWNEKINLISRKDTDFFYERHVLHSLGIAKAIDFIPTTKVLDIGTGGGFPGIPLAILFPKVQFTLIDSIEKKINVVRKISESIRLQNTEILNTRAENLKEKFHFVVSRAVTRMSFFLPWTDTKFENKNNSPFQNGILYLKGGDLSEELSGIKAKIFDLKDFFSEEFFETKKLIYISSTNISQYNSKKFHNREKPKRKPKKSPFGL